MFSVAGILFITLSRAAVSAPVVLEAESGAVAGSAKTVDDPAASGQRAVSFGTGGGGGTTDNKPNGNITGNWKQTFNDDFNGTTLNSTVWGVDDQGGNNEDETACFSPEAVSVSGGNLEISLTNKPCHGKANMGGQIYTKQFKQSYGFFEARINLPGRNGRTYNFPAFWILPYRGDAVCWPTGGEFDIMETIGGGASAHYGYGRSCDNVSNGWPGADPGGGDWTGWHTFAVDWQPGNFTVYYDGKKVGSPINDQGVTNPMNVVIDNVSRPMGGETVTGTKIQVDYVRVWQKQ